MTLDPAADEDIAWACQSLQALGAYPDAIARGLDASDPDALRAAFAQRLDAGRREGLRAIVERFRNKRGFAIWALLQSSRLHRESDQFSAALADIDALMQTFPERADVHLWHARARCLIRLGRDPEADATLREAMARFPDAPGPRAALAGELARKGRTGEALAILSDLTARWPDPGLDVFASLSRALRAAGRREEGLAALEEIGRRFPAERRTAPLLAEAAEERGQWARALQIWDDYAARFDAARDPQVAVGRARALFRLGRVDEATQALEDALARTPDQMSALRELAAITTDLGETARARDLRLRLLQRHGDISRPEWWAALARTRHDLSEDAAGAAALAELERRFPHSALAEVERLRLAKEREHGHDDLRARIEQARTRFPDDPDLRGHWVWILLSLGRLDEAEREVVALERDGASGPALTARFRLEADRGDENFRSFLARWREGRVFTVAEAIQAAYQLIEIRTPWAFEAGAAIVAETAAREPGHLRLDAMRARYAIALRRDDEALALIDALPNRLVRPDVLELRAWAATRRGEHDAAKALWREALAGGYYAAVAAPIHNLTRLSPDERPPPGEGVSAYVVFRNEAAQIPGFLAHHRGLGVQRFVLFDHQSTDGGREMALREPDVIVYDCSDSYQLSWSGRRWINEIVAREGATGWGLQLDMDERLIYPGCESLGIEGLVAYLDAHGFEAVRGFMLDVFAPYLVDEVGEPPPFSEHVWYDGDYAWFQLPRPPYLSPMGGVRSRLFEAKEYLHKVPLWRLDAGRLINSHETTALRFADVSAALLHYKLVNVALRGRGEAHRTGAAFLEPDADVEAIRRHARYAARLSRLWRSDLRAPGVSRRLEDSLALAGRGLMDAPDAWRHWVAAHG